MIALLAAAAALQPQVVATVDPKHRLVEGIATDGRTIWLSSVIDRTILTCRKGSCVATATLPKGGHPLGIAWDERRQRLWVTTDCPPVPGVDKCEQGELFALDRTGWIKARLRPAGANSFHPGDVSASPAGVFVSDALSGAVYRVSKNGGALTPLLAPNIGRSAQGSVVDLAGKRLIVADYGRGITALDLETGERTLFPGPDNAPIRGLDGLARCGNGYLATFNAQQPNRLVKLELAGGHAVARDLIVGGDLQEPTQLASDGRGLFVIANSGWQAAEKPEVRRRASVRILSYSLHELCRI